MPNTNNITACIEIARRAMNAVASVDPSWVPAQVGAARKELSDLLADPMPSYAVAIEWRDKAVALEKQVKELTDDRAIAGGMIEVLNAKLRTVSSQRDDAQKDALQMRVLMPAASADTTAYQHALDTIATLTERAERTEAMVATIRAAMTPQ